MKKCLKLRTRSKIVTNYALHQISVQGKLYIRGLPQIIFVAICLIPIVYFTGKYLEAIFQIISLFVLRYRFSKTYHAKTTMRCTFLTLSIGYLAIPRILPISLPLFGAMFMGFLIAFISWFAQEFIDRKKKIVELETPTIVEDLPFDIMTCSKEDFYKRCDSVGIKKDRYDYAWDLLRSHHSAEELSIIYYVAIDTIYQDRWRFKKKLKK